MTISRDLTILLMLMGVAFLIGYGIAESLESVDPEKAAIIAACSSAGGMVIGYIYLAFEKRDKLQKRARLTKRRYEFDPQVVGQTCMKCSQRVIFVSEAFFCADCGKPLHRRCGKPPRCEECDSRVTYANHAIIPEWDFDAKKMEWIPSTSDRL